MTIDIDRTKRKEERKTMQEGKKRKGAEMQNTNLVETTINSLLAITSATVVD